MPKFYKRNLLASPVADEEHLLEAPDSEIKASSPVSASIDDTNTKEWLAWTGPSRPHRKRDRSFYTTVATLIFLTILISLFLQEFLVIGALMAFGFLVYVINFVTPEDIDYKITSQGITIGDHFYHWQQLDSFWFTSKDGTDLLHVVTTLRFPAMLIVVLPGNKLEEIKKICAKYLPFHEIAPRTLMDKWSEGLQKHFPLEHPQKS